MGFQEFSEALTDGTRDYHFYLARPPFAHTNEKTLHKCDGIQHAHHLWDLFGCCWSRTTTHYHSSAHPNLICSVRTLKYIIDQSQPDPSPLIHNRHVIYSKTRSPTPINAAGAFPCSPPPSAQLNPHLYFLPSCLLLQYTPVCVALRAGRWIPST